MPKTTDKNKYFVVKERAVPEVLLNVVAAKKLLESKRAATVQEAADAVGILLQGRKCCFAGIAHACTFYYGKVALGMDELSAK